MRQKTQAQVIKPGLELLLLKVQDTVTRTVNYTIKYNAKVIFCFQITKLMIHFVSPIKNSYFCSIK